MKRIIPALCVVVCCAVAAQDPTPEPETQVPPVSETNADRRPESRDLQIFEGSETFLKAMDSIEEYLATQKAEEEKPSGEPLVLNARRSVEMAVSQNAQAQIAEADLEAARARIGQARSRVLPQIKGSVTYTRTELNQQDFSELIGGTGGIGGLGTSLGGGAGLGGIGGGGGGGLLGPVGRFVVGQVTQRVLQQFSGSQEFLDTPDDFRTDQITLSQVIYAGGQISAAIKASEYLAASQEWKREATLAQLEFEAKQAYYNAAATQALVRVAEASVSTFDRQLSDARQMFDVGMISNFEVLRAQTELGSRRANLVKAHNGRQLAFANLRRIISVPQETPLVLETRLDWLPYIPDRDELVDYAFEHRPEILALRRAIDASKEDIRRAKGQYKPSVGGNVQWQNVDGGGYAQPDGWTFSVGAQWDIATGGRRKYDVIEARSRLNSLEHQLKDLEAIVELDVTAAHIQINDSMARITAENGTRELAKEGLRLAELRFQEGAGTQSEVLDAELALTSAETALVQALRDFAVANSALERAIGRSWLRVSESPTPMDTMQPAKVKEDSASPVPSGS